METQNPSSAVVGIGSSAGGLEALREFFAAMPADSGAAFVVIQHLDPSHVSHMAEILTKSTAMNVVQAEDGMPLEADSVYTIPPDKFLKIHNGRLHLTETIKRDGMRMPIDFFFRSLAEDQHEKAICVILSGTGSDGTHGLREVRGAGGMTIVQTPETAEFDAMVRNAMATEMVDYVLPVREMPETILKYARQPCIAVTDQSDEQRKLRRLQEILDLLESQEGNDFGAYKKTTLLRRVERRMGLNHINRISDYRQFLQENPEEVARLSKDMLISVSSFFRDTEAFEELRKTVVVPLIREKTDNSPFRVWVPGCATGEEAYSLAILFMEELAAAKQNCPIQLFASDVDSKLVRFAREGVYPQSITADVSEERLKQFFTKQDDGGYAVTKPLRESVIFSVQNLLTEPPFSKLDFISCRNVLIYIEPIAQRRIISVFAFALRAGGYLFLGKSDGIAGQSELFRTVSQKWRVYRRTVSPKSRITDFPFLFEKMPPRVPQPLENFSRLNLNDLNQQVLLKHFNASVILIDQRGNILHFYGPTRRYLEHPTGEASLNLLNMIENRISAKLRVALQKTLQENEPVRLERIQFGQGDSNVFVNVTIMPVLSHGTSDRLLAVIFEDVRELSNASALSPRNKEAVGQESLVTHLESELKTLKDEYQVTFEEFERSAEELKAANEEVQSINEELQSANEELETSKEEIQAMNEELSTVNRQLNLKVEELTGVNNDLVNYLNSSEIGTIFLDHEFRIRRFTPSAAELMNLISSDVGRPLSHMTNKLVEVDLVADAETVLKNLSMTEREVQTSDGRWYAMRCLPYRTMNDKIDGVIFTFNDVTQLKRSEESMQEARYYAEGIVETVREALLVLDSKLRVVSANRAFYRTFQVTPLDTQNRRIYEVGARQWDIPELRVLLENILVKNNEFNDFEVEQDFPNVGHRTMLLNARRISRGANLTELILLSIEDFTARKRAEELLKSEETLHQKLTELEQQLISSGRLVSIGELTASMAHEFNNPLGIIMGFTQDLMSEIDPSEPSYRSLQIIDEETRRCKKIIEELLQFARPGDADFCPTDVREVMEKTTKLLTNRFYKQNIEVITRIDDNLPRIHADSRQIEQVLVNLYLNAIDAMPQGGTLRVEGKKAPDGVSITVTDTGFGIEDNELAKIFQPFFTSKKRTGLGLGLPICERIIRNHGGNIEVASQAGRGTTFRVYLPSARETEP
jgi:chemotaxis methyl-accepting protein methylase/signal transduction histidine kinase